MIVRKGKVENGNSQYNAISNRIRGNGKMFKR